MKKNTKKYWIVAGSIVMSLLLSACTSSGSTTPKTTETERTRIINGPQYEFNMTIPREWDVIESKDFTADVPKETVIVFRNNVKNEDFTSNVSIVKNTLQTTKETLEYAKQVINRQKSGLYNYKETKRDLVKISIGSTKVDTYITYFEAKRDPSSDLTQFIQTYAVKGTSAYIVLAAFSPKENTNNIKTVEDIVKSFTIK